MPAALIYKKGGAFLWQKKKSLIKLNIRMNIFQNNMLACVQLYKKDKIKAYADSKGESINGFVNKAIDKAMEE